MYEIRIEDLPEGLDYRRMWFVLQNEAACLAREKVRAMEPLIVLGYMNFIQGMAEFDKKGPTANS